MGKRHRDTRGRFCRPPKAPPIDPVIVKTLGAGRRPAIPLLDDYELTVTIVHPKEKPRR
jgi:hypothetical protein